MAAAGCDGRDRKKTVLSQPRMNETTFDTETLTFDPVEDILCRLPVKLLIQLRCVCKSWNSLISDPIFAKKHLRLSQTLFNRRHLISGPKYRRDHISCPCGRNFQLRDSPLPSVFNSTSTSIPWRRLSFPLNIQHGFPRNIQHDFYKVIGSCNGILCFSFGEYNNSVMVWNPSTRKFKKLPPLENQLELKPNGETVFGFGYDRLTDNYKVVAFDCYKIDGSPSNLVCKKIQVHTLGTDIWKTIRGLPSAFPFGSGFTRREYMIFFRGTVNRLGNTYLPSKPWVIFSFDLGNESYQELLPPDDGGVDVCTMTLGVLRDSLCILSLTHTLDYHVWLMEDYGNKDSWTKLFVVTYHGLKCAHAYPLYISDDDQLLLDFMSQLAVYNSRNHTAKILNVESFSDCRCSFDNHVYIESLISP